MLHKNRRYYVVLIIFISLYSISLKEIFAQDDSNQINKNNVGELRSFHELESEAINSITWSENGQLIALSIINGVCIYEFNANDLTCNQDNNKYLGGQAIWFIGVSDNFIVNFGFKSLVFDSDSLEVVRRIPHAIMDISPNGDLYVTRSEDRLSIWELESGNLLNVIEIVNFAGCEYLCLIQDTAFSNDGIRLAYAAAVPEIESGIYNVSSQSKLAVVDLGVSGLLYSPNDLLIASRSGPISDLSNGIMITNTRNGELVSLISLVGPHHTPAFDSSGEMLTVIMLDDQAPNPDEASSLLTFLDVQAALISENVADDSEIVLHQIPFNEDIVDFQYSPDFEILAVAEADGRLSFWKID